MSSNLSAGKETLSFCNKCQLNLAHIIVVMNSPSEIGKVKCKTCGSTHSHKSKPVKSAGMKTSVSKSAVSKAANKSAAKKSSVPVADLWRDAMAKSKGAVKAYTPKGSFIVGEVLEHVSFGQGIVQKTIEGNKIEVMFENDIKVLVHNIK